MRRYLLAAMIALPAAAQAHEIWIERDGTGPARIYLGEPAEAPPPGGDPEFAKLTAPKLLLTPTATPVRRAGFIEVAVPAGDVHAWDDAVFAPWGEPGKRESVIYYARAGRAATATKLPFELAPVAAGGDRFALTRDGKPVAAQEVTLIAPDRSERKLTTDARGMVTVPAGAPGRYLLTATRREGPATLPGGAVDAVWRTTTTSFVR